MEFIGTIEIRHLTHFAALIGILTKENYMLIIRRCSSYTGDFYKLSIYKEGSDE